MADVIVKTEVQKIAKSVESGTIASEKYQKLVEYYGWLSKPNAKEHISGQFDTVLNAVNFHMIRATLELVEYRSKKTARWVMALAIASLIGTFSQVWYAIKADQKSDLSAQSIAKQQQTINTKSESPYQETLPSLNQHKKKLN